MSTLYLVATPIGNLEDISFRALDTLRSVRLIAAEDTRTARHLLSHYNIPTPVTSLFEHSRAAKIERVLNELELGDVALISEAGTPAINDPGEPVVRGALERGHRVSPIPGPSAVLAALVGSGLPAGAFYYVGFFPREPQARRRFLRELASETETIVAFETPHRLNKALEDMERVLGPDRRICVARELTKVFQEFQRGTIAQVRAHFNEHAPRGEFTLVIQGRPSGGTRRRKEEAWDKARVRLEIERRIAAGMPRTEAVKQVARAAEWDRREVYALALGQRRPRPPRRPSKRLNNSERPTSGKQIEGK
jgi:16S rRNA (cytidine1402-2'-O)-methyltransferase